MALEQENTNKIFIITTTKVSNSPIAVHVSDNFVYVLDNFYNYYEIPLDGSGVSRSLSLVKNHKLLHKYSKAIAFSSQKDIALCTAGAKSIAILTFVTGVLASKTFVNWHEKEVETTAFSTDGTLFSSGGADGRAIIYDASNHYKIISILEKRPDYICALAFSPDNRFLLSASFDKEIIIYDIQRNIVHSHYKLADIVERAYFFEFEKIFIITRGGSSYILDIFEGQTTSQKSYFSSWPVSLEVASDMQTAIIGTKNENFYVVNMQTNTLLLSLKLENSSGVTNLRLIDGVLIICYSDGRIDFVDYARDTKRLKMAIRSKNYEVASKLIKQNCFFSLDGDYIELFNQGWKECLPSIIKLISEQMPDEAIKIAEPFLNDEKRAKEFEFYMSKNKEVEQLAELISKSDLAGAYRLAEKNNYLKKLGIYQAMEENWRKAFNLSRKLLEEDALLNQKKVVAILKPYIDVEDKKKIAYSLLTNVNKFIEATNAVKRRDFLVYFDLVEKNQFLKETELYQKTIAFAQSILDKVQECEIDGRVEEAMEKIKLLKMFKPFMVTATIKESNLSEIYTFHKLVKSSFEDDTSLKQAYSMAMQNPNLQSLPIFQELSKEFRELYREAMKLVEEAKITELHYLLDKYMKIDFYRQKIKELFKQAFIRELEIEHASKSKTAIENGIKRYVGIFSIEPQIEKYAHKHHLTQFLESIQNRQSVIYTVFEYPKSIFV